MKALNILTIAAVIATLATSCSMKDNYTPAVAEPVNNTTTTASSVKTALKINAGFNGTKAGESVVKNSWDVNESIAVVSSESSSRFLSINAGDRVEFASCSATFDASSVAAVFPYNSRVAEGYSFSFADQTGSADYIKNYCLMTAKGSVKNGVADLTFDQKVAVIAIENANCDGKADEAAIKSVSLNGVATSAEVSFSNGTINVAAGEQGSISVYSSLEDTLYIAFLAAGQSSIEIEINDNFGGEFFYTLDNGSAFQAGQTYSVSGATFQGGYAITFSPSVANWD